MPLQLLLPMKLVMPLKHVSGDDINGSSLVVAYAAPGEGGGGVPRLSTPLQAVQSTTTLPRLSIGMGLLCTELDNDEMQEKSMQEHLGVVCWKVGYTI